MRVGLFGGTFNPIHLGHLKAIQRVQKQFALNKCCLIPSAIPPHKNNSEIADAQDRVEMIRLALSSNSVITKSVVVSDVELKRNGLSYTIDTIHYFKKTSPKDNFYLIVGLDAFLEIDTWKSFKKIFTLIPLIVMARQVKKGEIIGNELKNIEYYLKNNISDDYALSVSKSCFVHTKTKKQPVFFIDTCPLEISSTKIRTLIKKGMSIKGLTPEKVENFIKNRGLYL